MDGRYRRASSDERLAEQFFDLGHQGREIRALEAHLFSGHAIALDIRRYVRVVRVIHPQGGIVGMRLRVVPALLLIVTLDLVAIAVDHHRQPVEDETLADHHAVSMIEAQLAGYACECRAATR